MFLTLLVVGLAGLLVIALPALARHAESQGFSFEGGAPRIGRP